MNTEAGVRDALRDIGSTGTVFRRTAREGVNVMNDDDVVNIVDPVSQEVVTHCLGPTAEGMCPQASPQGIVLCHGCRIQAANLGPEYWNLWVPPTSKACPRTWHLDEVGY